MASDFGSSTTAGSGSGVGSIVGSGVGALVGFSVGSGVGDGVGSGVGSSVGSGDGVAVDMIACFCVGSAVLSLTREETELFAFASVFSSGADDWLQAIKEIAKKHTRIMAKILFIINLHECGGLRGKDESAYDAQPYFAYFDRLSLIPAYANYSRIKKALLNYGGPIAQDSFAYQRWRIPPRPLSSLSGFSFTTTDLNLNRFFPVIHPYQIYHLVFLLVFL